MSRSRPVALVCALGVLSGVGCSIGLVHRGPMGVEFKRKTQFESQWSRYLDFEGIKALAVAGDVEGRYVLGYARVSPSEKDAIAAALTACELRRSDRRLREPCRLYAVGEVPVSRQRNQSASASRASSRRNPLR